MNDLMCIFIYSSFTNTHSLTTTISPQRSFLTTLITNQKWQSFYRQIEDWDVSKVTSMYGMFANKANCNPDISNWNTSSVTSFVSQFVASTFLLRSYSVEHYESKQTNTSLTLSFFSTSQYHHYSPRYYDDLDQYGTATSSTLSFTARNVLWSFVFQPKRVKLGHLFSNYFCKWFGAMRFCCLLVSFASSCL